MKLVTQHKLSAAQIAEAVSVGRSTVFRYLDKFLVFNHIEDRVQAHILVCLLVLALWRTLEQWMQTKGLGTCAQQLVKEMAGIKSVDVAMPVRRAEITTEPPLRVVTTPEPATAQRLAHLGLRLPIGTQKTSNVAPKSHHINYASYSFAGKLSFELLNSGQPHANCA